MHMLTFTSFLRYFLAVRLVALRARIAFHRRGARVGQVATGRQLPLSALALGKNRLQPGAIPMLCILLMR